LLVEVKVVVRAVVRAVVKVVARIRVLIRVLIKELNVRFAPSPIMKRQDAGTGTILALQ
jgi:hypothetical protein